MEDEHVGGLIDFYFACTGKLLYDVAITVNDWCVSADGKLDTAHTRAMLNAYHAARPFTRRRSRSLAHGLARGGTAFLDLAPVRFASSARR